MKTHYMWLWIGVTLVFVGCRLNIDGDDAMSSDLETASVGRGLVGVDCSAVPMFPLASAWPKTSGDTLKLSGLIRVTDEKTVNGSVVIEPGTTFVMEKDSSLNFGWNSGKTTLTASGTAALPIRFCAELPVPGHFAMLMLDKGLTSDSVAEHIEVSGGGGAGYALGVAAPIGLSDAVVRASSQTGLRAREFGAGSARVSVQGSGGDAIELSQDDALKTLPTDLRIEGNVRDIVRLTFTDITPPLSIPKLPVPYVQSKDIDVVDGLLEWAAGVDYRFEPDVYLLAGWNSHATEVQIRGTALEPVVFGPASPERGQYGGFGVGAQVAPASKISHLLIEGGGSKDYAPLTIHAPITLDDVQVQNALHPVLITSPLNPASNTLTILGSPTYPLEIRPDVLTSVPLGGTFIGNAEDTIHVTQGNVLTDVVATIANPGVPFVLDTDVDYGEGTDLTIGPGAQFLFASGYRYGLSIGWNYSKARVHAAGTAAEPIVFKSQSGAAASWSGLTIGTNVSTDSSLDHVQVDGASLTLSSAITVTSSSFSNSDGYGIAKSKSDATDYSLTNTFANNALGDISP